MKHFSWNSSNWHLKTIFHKPRILCWFVLNFVTEAIFPITQKKPFFYFLTQNIFFNEIWLQQFSKTSWIYFSQSKNLWRMEIFTFFVEIQVLHGVVYTQPPTTPVNYPPPTELSSLQCCKKCHVSRHGCWRKLSWLWQFLWFLHYSWYCSQEWPLTVFQANLHSFFTKVIPM